MTSNFFDSVTEAINGGVAYADRKTQIIRYRSELSTLAKQKAQAFSDLGQAVLNREAANQQFVNAYAGQVSAIRSIEQRENELKMQIDVLQQQDMTSNTGGQPQSGKVCAHLRNALPGSCRLLRKLRNSAGGATGRFDPGSDAGGWDALQDVQYSVPCRLRLV